MKKVWLITDWDGEFKMIASGTKKTAMNKLKKVIKETETEKEFWTQRRIDDTFNFEKVQMI